MGNSGCPMLGNFGGKAWFPYASAVDRLERRFFFLGDRRKWVMCFSSSKKCHLDLITSLPLQYMLLPSQEPQKSHVILARGSNSWNLQLISVLESAIWIYLIFFSRDPWKVSYLSPTPQQIIERQEQRNYTSTCILGKNRTVLQSLVHDNSEIQGDPCFRVYLF